MAALHFIQIIIEFEISLPKQANTTNNNKTVGCQEFFFFISFEQMCFCFGFNAVHYRLSLISIQAIISFFQLALVFQFDRRRRRRMKNADLSLNFLYSFS